MKLRHRSVGLVIVVAALCVPSFTVPAEAQSRPLNPLVPRSNLPAASVPAECEQGLSPAPALRVEVREIPVEDIQPLAETTVAQAPPSSALRAALQETQAALMRNDRPAFDAALARERSLASAYPTGGERRAADDVVRLHEAAARLWDAQYRSPFFGEDDPEYALASAWPGYADAVRPSVYTDEGGRRFYPAGESRDFVTRLAAERLQRGGMSEARSSSSASPRTSTSRRPRELMEPPPGMPRAKRNPVTTSRTPSRSTATAAKSSSTPSPKPAVTTPAPSSPNPSAPPTVTAAPEPAPAVVTETEPVTTSTPVAGDLPTEDVPVPATTPPATTVDSTVDATTTEVVPVTRPPARGRSVILPTILILIGLGVLIVLFRASK